MSKDGSVSMRVARGWMCAVRGDGGTPVVRARTVAICLRLCAMALGLLGILGGCGSDGRAPAEPKPPNLLMILVDTLRADHLGYAGYPREVSPFVDALRQRSVAFVNHYSHASRTGPSVASLFTGLHPRSHGVVNPISERNAIGILTEEQVTLAEILTSHGYTCMGYICNPNVAPRFGFAQGFAEYEPVRTTQAPQLSQRGIEAFDRMEEPFFLYLHYMEPHSPYWAPQPYQALFEEGGYEGPITGTHQQLDEILEGKLAPDEADLDQLRTLYDRAIRFGDDYISAVVEGLRSRELLHDTVIVFVSDHGEEFWEHGSVLHGYTLYEEQLRVPLLISAPRFRQARTVEAVTRHVDVLPTLLELLGIDSPVEGQGTSLVPWMTEAKTGDVGPVHAEASIRAVKTVQGSSFLSAGYKLIETRLPQPRQELYHLASDPTEQHDLIDRDAEVAARLRAEMHQFEAGLKIGKGGEVTLTPEEIEKLRALGYMN